MDCDRTRHATTAGHCMQGCFHCGIGRRVVHIPSATLPECPHRADSSTSTLYICSHSHVRAANGLVTVEICQRCNVRELPSESVQRTGRAGQRPRLLRQAWNVTQAMAAFVADGCRTLDEDAYRQRLEVCEGCGQRQGNQCVSCGCRLTLKARGRAFQCPLGKWPEATEVKTTG